MQIRSNAMDQALETIRNRIDQLGVRETTVAKEGESEILVQLPGIQDPERAKELIGKTAVLEFKIVDDSQHRGGRHQKGAATRRRDPVRLTGEGRQGALPGRVAGADDRGCGHRCAGASGQPP